MPKTNQGFKVHSNPPVCNVQGFHQYTVLGATAKPAPSLEEIFPVIANQFTGFVHLAGILPEAIECAAGIIHLSSAVSFYLPSSQYMILHL